MIRLVVPFSGGGILDVLARAIGAQLATDLGQPVIIDNRPGAGGNIGTDAVARSTPDGYTLLISGVSLVTALPLQPDLGFDPMKTLAPVAMLASTPGLILTQPNAPYRTPQELVAYAKAHPEPLNYASAGIGSLGHLLGAWLNSVAGTNLVHVPYKGGSAALVDVLAGRVPLWIDIASNRQLVESGKLRALAVTSRKRSPFLPNTPTLVESGIAVEGSTWWALMAPAATPPAVVERLTATVAKIIASAALREQLTQLGVDPDYRPPAEVSAFMRAESDKWSRVIASANIHIGG